MIHKCSCRRWYRLYIGIAVACLAVVPALAQFETRAIQPTAPYFGAFSIASGDFNNDGKLDIAVTGDNGFTIWLGNGDGTFQKPIFVSTALSDALAVADFNHDGNLDIVVANADQNPNTVSVYLGNGDGTFKAPIKSNTTGSNGYIVVGDFNNDGKPDIAVIDNPYISVLLGNGDGTFQPPSDNDSFVGAEWLAVGDFNNDHKLDVIASGQFGGNDQFAVFLGNGDGTLQSALTYPLTYISGAVAVADFNQDGNLDAVVGQGYGAIDVFQGKGDGSFRPGVLYDTTGLSGGPLVVCDFNVDGKLDIAVQSFPSGGVDVFWGDGGGTFAPAQILPSGESGYPVVGDFNQDHMPDLAMANELYVTTMLNTGVASFFPSGPVIFPMQLVNSSGRESVKLTNSGASALTISSIKVSGQFQVNNTCGSSVASGASCKISAEFKPASPGAYSGLIELVDSASSKPQFIELSGSATAVQLSLTSMNFGSQKVGTKSKAQTVTATNVGPTPISFASINILGDFSETNTCLSGKVAPGGSCSVEVTFAPTKTGSRTGTLFINVQGGFSPPHVALSGTGDL
jgi:hypothetical protein